jgi:hypothetical protein
VNELTAHTHALLHKGTILFFRVSKSGYRRETRKDIFSMNR